MRAKVEMRGRKRERVVVGKLTGRWGCSGKSGGGRVVAPEEKLSCGGKNPSDGRMGGRPSHKQSGHGARGGSQDVDVRQSCGGDTS